MGKIEAMFVWIDLIVRVNLVYDVISSPIWCCLLKSHASEVKKSWEITEWYIWERSVCLACVNAVMDMMTRPGLTIILN